MIGPSPLLLAAALAATGVGCASVPAVAAPDPATGFLFESLHQGGRTYRYALYVPRGYDGSAEWPLIVFLHGSGESGSDGARMIIQGIGSAILWNAGAWPALVLFPQKPTDATEWEQHEEAVMEMLARTRARFRVDAARISLTGLSQGGHGAWVLGARHAGLWAAVVPICGYAEGWREGKGDGLPPPYRGGPGPLAARLAGTPVWAFHGEADDVVPAEQTRALVAALRQAGASPRITLFPGVGHGSWDPAYRDPELPRWLLAQRRR